MYKYTSRCTPSCPVWVSQSIQLNSITERFINKPSIKEHAQRSSKGWCKLRLLLLLWKITHFVFHEMMMQLIIWSLHDRFIWWSHFLKNCHIFCSKKVYFILLYSYFLFKNHINIHEYFKIDLPVAEWWWLNYSVNTPTDHSSDLTLPLIPLCVLQVITDSLVA